MKINQNGGELFVFVFLATVTFGTLIIFICGKMYNCQLHSIYRMTIIG